MQALWQSQNAKSHLESTKLLIMLMCVCVTKTNKPDSIVRANNFFHHAIEKLGKI